MKLALFLLVAAVAVASTSAFLPKKGAYLHGLYRWRYYGFYKGACGPDGVYAASSTTLVFCTNGRAVFQKCAPGTAISGLKKGHFYTRGAVCNVNLIG